MKALAVIVLSLALEIGFLLQISIPGVPRPEAAGGQASAASEVLRR